MKNQIHWNLHKKQWTSHTYKHCSIASTILVEGDWKTEVKPTRRTNSRGWVVCDHKQVTLNPSDEQIYSKYRIAKRLMYDKISQRFNIESGQGLLFVPGRCFIIEEKRN